MKVIKTTSVFVFAALMTQACGGGSPDKNNDNMIDAEEQMEMQKDEMEDREKTVKVGGAEMYPSKNIIENAMNSEDHTTLVAAIKAADLVATLEGPGPFTVFAPTNKAFEKLPAGTVDNLLKPANKKMLQGVLTYHVVAGNYNADQLNALIDQNGGNKAELKTVQGGKLWVEKKMGKLVLTDEKGGTAQIDTKDVYQSNGVIHVVDAVLMHK